MKRVEALVEFRDKETGETHKPGDKITVSEERLEAIRTVQENIVQVLGEAEPEKEELKEEDTVDTEPEDVKSEDVDSVEDVELVEEIAPVQPKKSKK